MEGYGKNCLGPFDVHLPLFGLRHWIIRAYVMAGQIRTRCTEPIPAGNYE